jgi:hypothetical protein
VAILKNTTTNNQCLRMQNSDASQYFQPESGYVATRIAVTLNSTLPYLNYSTANITVNNYASTSYAGSTIAEIYLVK